MPAGLLQPSDQVYLLKRCAVISQQTQAVATAAKAIYEARLRVELEANHLHEFVAIEPNSGDHFLGYTLSAAIRAARAAHPNCISFALRIGHETAVHLGEMTL